MKLAILSDIHEDFERLQKAFKKIDQKGCDMRICLGDISGYSEFHYNYTNTRNAPACLELIREKCDIIIPGNHDLHAAGKIPELPEGSSTEYWPHEEDLDPGYGEEEVAFLAALPDYEVLTASGYNILLSHYIEPNLMGLQRGFYKRGPEFGAHFQLMQKLQCKLGFTGHSHIHGFYTAVPERLRHYAFTRHRLKEFPVVIGIPPITRNNFHSRFCIFDTDTYLLQVFKLL